MFEKENASIYKCKGCKHFNLQWEEKTLNIRGVVQKVTLWIPLCMDAFRINALYLAIEKCRNFERKE